MKRIVFVLALILSFALVVTFVYGEGNDEYTVLLLHNNGANGSTSFVDDSYAGGHTVTAHGDVQIDTAQSKFGGASGLFGGSGSYLSLADSNDWNFGTGDFTIDSWIRFSVIPPNGMFICKMVNSPSSYWSFWQSIGPDELYFTVYQDGIGSLLSLHGTWTGLTTDTWYHIAAVRSGDDWYLFINGTQIATTNVSITMPEFSESLYIGRDNYPPPGEYFSGWIDELRISKGIARWTADFTPPTQEYSIAPVYPPTADAGSDLEAYVGEEVILDGSGSYDSDGEIVSWVWRGLSDPQNPIVAEGEVTTMNAHGYAEELIELTVTDNHGATATDTMIITNPGTEGPQGPIGLQGPQGLPGMTPAEVVAMQGQINTLQQQNAAQQQRLDEDRYLLEQLPQLKHALEELQSQLP